MTTSASRVVHVYCDEAYTEHQYRVQGGIWVRPDCVRPIKQAFAELKTRHPWLKEMKWTRITGSFVNNVYLEALDLFFDRFADEMWFNCMVIRADLDPTFGADTATRNRGFRMAYKTLLLHRLEPGNSYRIALDERACKTVDPDGTLLEGLNRALRGFEGAPAVLSCRSTSSASDDLLQLADLLCGAVGWACNGQSASKSEAKRVFAAHLTTYRHGRPLHLESSRSDWKFNIWRYRPRR